MKRLTFRARLFAALVPLVALACFTAGTAQASNGAALKVTCTTSITTSTSTSTSTSSSRATLSARVSRRGNSRSTASGGKVASGGTVVCQVEVADPDAASATAVNFTPATTGPAGERTDTFTGGAPGDGMITYTLVNGDASITFTFKYKIVAVV